MGRKEREGGSRTLICKGHFPSSTLFLSFSGYLQTARTRLDLSGIQKHNANFLLARRLQSLPYTRKRSKCNGMAGSPSLPFGGVIALRISALTKLWQINHIFDTLD